jgi:hypothetical protein
MNIEEIVRKSVENIDNFKANYIGRSFYIYLGKYGNEWFYIGNFENKLGNNLLERILRRNESSYFEDEDNFYKYRNINKREKINIIFDGFCINLILILQYDIEDNMFKYGLFIDIVMKGK